MEDTRRAFWKNCGTPRDRRNQRIILAWMLAWTVSWLLVSVGINHDVIPPGGPAIAGAVFSAALGIGMVVVYRRFLREADELRRKIELDAFALAAGVGVVGAVTYWLLERAGAIGEADMLNVAVVMVCMHAIGVVLGERRYA